MSREVDAMQFLLDLLTDGIVESGANQQIGFTPHDKITQSQMPFVQVFTIATENSDQTVQIPGVLSVSLEIHDVSGQKDVLRDALEQLDFTLRFDQSFQGTVVKSVMTDRAVAERGDLDRTIATATIGIQLRQGFPEPNVTSLLDMSAAGPVDVADGVAENSKHIQNALGLRRDIASTAPLIATFDSGGAFPDIPVAEVQRLRLLYYTSPEYSRGITSVALRLWDSPSLIDGAQFNPAQHQFVGGQGWRDKAFDIRATPDTTFGAGWNGSTIGAVGIVWTMVFSASFSSLQFGLILLNFGYDARDTGLNNGAGYRPGF